MMIMARTLWKAAAVTAAAGSLALAACSSGGPTSGTETFTLTTHSISPNPVYHAVASGVFSATGTVQATSGSSSAPLLAKFPDGTFRLGHLTAGHTSANVDPKSCAATFNQKGTNYKLSNGTGGYTGISGSGNANLKFTGTLPKLGNGRCNTTNSGVPKAGTTTTTVHATGSLTIP
jgi:hypothetical protein